MSFQLDEPQNFQFRIISLNFFPQKQPSIILQAYALILACIINFKLIMADTSPISKRKSTKQQPMKLSYCFKPRTNRHSPLDRYDLSVLQSSDANGGEITDCFNYGFNSETFPLYAKLCKRFAEAEDIEHPNAAYDSNANNQFKFNDDAPIDLGGFGPFLDKELAEIWENDSFSGNQSLMSFFVHFLFNSRCINNLTQFVKLLSENQENKCILEFMDMLADKIRTKYERSIIVLKKQEENAAIVKQRLDSEQLSTLGQEGKDLNFYDELPGSSSYLNPLKAQRKILSIEQQVKREKIAKEEENEAQGDSVSYSSMLKSQKSQDGNESDGSSSDHGRYQSKKRNPDEATFKHNTKPNSRRVHEEDAPNNHRKGHLKKQKSEHNERSSHHKKHKKKKSKKINKNKCHKKHKKHVKQGKHSKKHRR